MDIGITAVPVNIVGDTVNTSNYYYECIKYVHEVVWRTMMELMAYYMHNYSRYAYYIHRIAFNRISLPDSCS